MTEIKLTDYSICIISGPCQTIDGTYANHTCIIPFTHNGETHDGCTDIDDKERNYWCVYELDGQGQPVAGAWGYCSRFCPVSSITQSTDVASNGAGGEFVWNF